MDEQEFDALFQRPFGRQDAMQVDARLRRCATLAAALWGRTSDDLRRQLIASTPEIPSGFDLADFRALERSVQMISARLSDQRFSWLSPRASSSPIISVGARRFTLWEARCEVVRRAIKFLGNR